VAARPAGGRVRLGHRLSGFGPKCPVGLAERGRPAPGISGSGLAGAVGPVVLQLLSSGDAGEGPRRGAECPPLEGPRLQRRGPGGGASSPVGPGPAMEPLEAGTPGRRSGGPAISARRAFLGPPAGRQPGVEAVVCRSLWEPRSPDPEPDRPTRPYPLGSRGRRAGPSDCGPGRRRLSPAGSALGVGGVRSGLSSGSGRHRTRHGHDPLGGLGRDARRHVARPVGSVGDGRIQRTLFHAGPLSGPGRSPGAEPVEAVAEAAIALLGPV